MWVICAGAQRSGSTLQYNIAARIVELTGAGFRIKHSKTGEFENTLDRNSAKSGFKVYKSHEIPNGIEKLLENKQCKIIYAYRDLRDVIVSLSKKGWIDKSSSSVAKVVHDYLELNTKWEKLCSSDMLISRYEDFYNNIEDEVDRIANHIGIEISAPQISQIAEELDPRKIQEIKGELTSQGKYTFNSKTLLHENHIQGRSPGQFKNDLSDEIIVEIERIAYKWLEQKGYELYWPNTDYFLSNSQHADDYIAWLLLNKKNRGTVVEVGAFDGVHLSNSYSLEKIGWNSICIEPNPNIYRYLKKQRINSKNVNCAIGSAQAGEKAIFYVEEIGVLSGFNIDVDDLRSRYEGRGLEYKDPVPVEVEVKSLISVLDENLDSDVIDVLSIDVEGFEIEVLDSLDFSKYSPKIVIIEANSDVQQSEIENHFNNLSVDYILIGNSKQNLFFGISSVFDKPVDFSTLNYDYYRTAVQYHPVSDNLTIQSNFPFKSKTDHTLPARVASKLKSILRIGR